MTEPRQLCKKEEIQPVISQLNLGGMTSNDDKYFSLLFHLYKPCIVNNQIQRLLSYL